YLLPDGQSFLCLALMRATQSLEVFPGKPSFLVTTYLSDGTRVVSSNYRGGYRKPLPMALVGRSFPDAEHPEALIKCHQALVERLCRDGRTPAPLDPALIVDRMIEEHEATRPLMEQVGYYTWEDAFRESFDLPRPEYRE
ncbi:MAG: hypothetical protein K0Q72_4581, partial [Armatimonadetes bacterium]|nr:hypothetical protein [Armatimonadota bacterium]